MERSERRRWRGAATIAVCMAAFPTAGVPLPAGTGMPGGATAVAGAPRELAAPSRTTASGLVAMRGCDGAGLCVCSGSRPVRAEEYAYVQAPRYAPERDLAPIAVRTTGLPDSLDEAEDGDSAAFSPRL